MYTQKYSSPVYVVYSSSVYLHMNLYIYKVQCLCMCVPVKGGGDYLGFSQSHLVMGGHRIVFPNGRHIQLVVVVQNHHINFVK